MLHVLDDWDRDQRLIDQTLDRCFQVTVFYVSQNNGLRGTFTV